LLYKDVKMEEIEVSAKTVDEAIEEALKKLNCSLNDVEVTVLKKAKSGILGLGSEEACIRVRLKEPEGESGRIARKTLENILKLMNIDATVERVGTSSSRCDLNIEGEDLGILIGRRGQTLASLEYLLRLIISHQLKERFPLSVDVEGYKERRWRSLQRLAQRLAQEVEESGTSITLEPMPPADRKVIHLSLASNSSVTAQSIGEGENRKVIISPKISDMK
jgi:spoIIIJ-associated protein